MTAAVAEGAAAEGAAGEPAATAAEPEEEAPRPKGESGAKRSSGDGGNVGRSIDRSIFTGGTVADNTAGVIMGVILWLWVGLPLIKGGPSQVRDVWRAKLFNKDPEGGWLP